MLLTLLFGTYWAAVSLLFAYGLNAYVLVLLHRRHAAARARRHARVRAAFATLPDARLPVVTVQLPVYNERFVVERVVDAAAALDWPRDRLQIQVLDDSTDDTSAYAARAVARARARGLDVEHRRRARREGFKAGALRDGLASARGSLVAVLDADFVPRPDFLRRTVPLFGPSAWDGEAGASTPGAGPRPVGLVQARWDHLDRDASWLTRAQALAIDGHFGIEQSARSGGGLLFNFNGTAGLWRRAAIEDAGGWQSDTLTEDLDLSYRAQLAGWRAEYAMDTAVPAELPSTLSAFKSQQRRWAKGSIQTALKLGGRVLAAPLSPFVKIQALLHLTHYAMHPLMLAVAVLAVPLLLGWGGAPAPLPLPLAATLLLLATAGPSALYLHGQLALHPARAGRHLRALPALVLLGTGLSVSNTRAVLAALCGRAGSFVRTPKHGTAAPRGAAAPGALEASAEQGGYRVPLDPIVALELALSVWSAWGVVLYARAGHWTIGPFLALYAAGFGACGLATLREARRPGPVTVTPPPRGASEGSIPTRRGDGTMATPLTILVLGALLSGACLEAPGASWPAAAREPGASPEPVAAPARAKPAAATAPPAAEPAPAPPASAEAASPDAGQNARPDAGLHATFDALVGEHVVGGLVDYAALAEDRAELKDYLATLADTDPDALGRDARMALWINAYNAFTLELILREYPDIESIKDIPRGRRWKGELWTVGGERYSLDQIEHEILRPMGDARIHFAVNCASLSCPDLREEAYVGPRLDEQLDDAGRRFLADTSKGLRYGDEKGFFGTDHVVRLSKIFDWFEEDFETNGSVIDFVLRFAPDDAAAYVRRHRDDLDIEYLDYDWSLNDV